MKKCPYCAEEIQDAAVKCKHCQSELMGSKTAQKIVDTHKSNGKTFQLFGIVVMVAAIPGCEISQGVGVALFVIGFLLAIIGRFLE